MEKRLGIIAGSGEVPFLIFKEVEKLGYFCLIAGMDGDAEVSLADSIEKFRWFKISQVENIINYFKQANIHEVLFAGKIDHRRIYMDQDFSAGLFDSLSQKKDKSPTSLICLAIEYLSKRGLTVLDPTQFLPSLFSDEGILSKVEPSSQIEKDINFGWEKTRVLADSDIGQTVVIKDTAVVAVEGMEGTDAAIRRGGELAGPGTVVIKLSRSRQDPRIDLPAVGVSTMREMVHAGCAALCVEAHNVAIFQKEAALSLADAEGIVVVARKDQ
ncbi:MAG: UDP-2,3-diacylglucosamine diphosphatase LpxI [Candidatus Aminicenantes bacterium]|nr:UDP-2,3-diacylglucosamine diphosphatase LpxI [Candidatus Aminicenantes bacterium]